MPTDPRKNLPQEIIHAIYGLWQRAQYESDPEEIKEIGREILRLDPAGLHGFHLLALGSDVLPEKEAFLREAVRLGDLRWKPAINKETEEEFEATTTYCKSYMTALWDLASFQLANGATEEAIKRAKYMLKIDPRDGMAARWIIAIGHINLGRYEEAEKFLGKYPDEISPQMQYSRLLVAHMLKKDTKDALAEALRANQNVARMVLDESFSLHRSWGRGSIEEAENYLFYACNGWEDSGADHWLYDQARAPRIV